MRFTIGFIGAAAVLVLFSAGCYTQLYRPEMETARQRQQAMLYNRYDSTAIDTTLRRDTTAYDPQPYTDYNYGWNAWGGYRPHRTRWGFDFDRFDPSYYWSYYGYYDYYARPWWDDWYDPYWGWGHYPGSGGSSPGEPPSRRPVGRRDRDSGGGGATYSAPPPASNPAYSAPATPPPAKNPDAPAVKDTPKNNNGSSGSDDGKRDGKRGR
jgi:hypothetical protein